MRRAWLVALLFLSGCWPFNFDLPVDAGEVDAGALDAGDAGEGDAGVVDAGNGPDAGAWCPPGALLCEDFETSTPTAHGFSVNATPNLTAGVSNAMAHSGLNSFRVALDINPGVQEYKLVHSLDSGWPLYLRAWVYVDQPTQDEVLLAGIRSSSSGNPNVSLGVSGGMAGGMFEGETFIKGTQQGTNVYGFWNPQLPSGVYGRWHCFVAWISGSNGQAFLFMDRADAGSADLTFAASQTFDELVVGPYVSNSHMPMTIYYDDVSASNAQLTCP